MKKEINETSPRVPRDERNLIKKALQIDPAMIEPMLRAKFQELYSAKDIRASDLVTLSNGIFSPESISRTRKLSCERGRHDRIKPEMLFALHHIYGISIDQWFDELLEKLV